MKHAPTRRDKKALYSTAKKTIEMKFFWMIELYRRLLETLSSSETKKLKISKTVRYNSSDSGNNNLIQQLSYI